MPSGHNFRGAVRSNCPPNTSPRKFLQYLEFHLLKPFFLANSLLLSGLGLNIYIVIIAVIVVVETRTATRVIKY